VFEGIKNVLNNIERLKTSKNNYGMLHDSQQSDDQHTGNDSTTIHNMRITGGGGGGHRGVLDVNTTQYMSGASTDGGYVQRHNQQVDNSGWL
jgi:hypothetical protein